VDLNLGSPIQQKDFTESQQKDTGKLLNEITNYIHSQLSSLVYEINPADKIVISQKFYHPVSFIKKLLLVVPAAIGWLIHVPFFFPIKKLIRNKTLHSGHYDSIIVGVAVLFYPVYLFIFSLVLYYFLGGYSWLFILIISPLSFLSYLHLKKQL